MKEQKCDKHDHSHDHNLHHKLDDSRLKDEKIEVENEYSHSHEDNSQHEHDHSHHHEHHDENMYGVFLHVLADTLGSVAVIISSLCINIWGTQIADPICCFLISALILGAAIPFTKQTARVLTLGLHKNTLREKAKKVLE